MNGYSHRAFTPPPLTNLIINTLQKHTARYKNVVCCMGMHINPKYIQI